MNSLHLRDEVGREINLIPEEKLQDLYSVVHAFRLAVTVTEHAPHSFPIHPQRAIMQRQVEAFETMHMQLWNQFPEQFVALHNEQLVDHDIDELALLERIERKYPAQVVLIRQVTESLPADLIIRSPRFVTS